MKRLLVIVVIIFLCSGCFLDPYKNEKEAEDAIDAWFSYVNKEDDLGSSRKKIEGINSIKERVCEYVTNDDYLRYVYKCKISYVANGKTIIPLAKDEVMYVYVVLSYNEDRTYQYVVYNSSSEEGIWEQDEYLNYGKPRQ